MTAQTTDLQCAVVHLVLNLDNDFPEMLRYFGEKGRVNFVHARNVKLTGGSHSKNLLTYLNMVQSICTK